ncbi:hypothetical protein RGUI_3605 [Rhodovulum sp. P5]|nr:hypothetical protein RGUI_3605 [Rhodovulum sp. P5]
MSNACGDRHVYFRTPRVKGTKDGFRAGVNRLARGFASGMSQLPTASSIGRATIDQASHTGQTRPMQPKWPWPRLRFALCSPLPRRPDAPPNRTI